MSSQLTPRDGTSEVQTVWVQGVPVRVHIRGSGPTLLLLSGIGGHVAMWEPLAQQLEETRTLVMFDAPGAGNTPPLRRPARMPGLASFVLRVLDEVAIRDFDLLGYSWGGALAQQVARDAHRRVRRLVLAATVPGAGGWPPPPRVAMTMLSRERYKNPEASQKAAALIYGGDYRLGSSKPGTALSSWNQHPPSWVGYAQQLFAITGWSSLPWLRDLRVQTLIISGGDDPVVPAVNARMLARLIPEAELHLIPSAGHLWLLDHATESSALIDEFLARP